MAVARVTRKARMARLIKKRRAPGYAPSAREGYIILLATIMQQ
jgi:hypothetical protein